MNKKVILGATIAAVSVGAVAFAASNSMESKSDVGRIEAVFDYDIATVDKAIDNIYAIAVQEFGAEETDNKDTKIRNLKNLGLLDDVGLFGGYDGDVKITREMMVQLISSMVDMSNKNNVPSEYVMTLQDGGRYSGNMEYVTYNKLIDSGTEYFVGETTMTNDEANYALEELMKVMDKTEPVEFKVQESNVSEVYGQLEDIDAKTQNSKIEAANTLEYKQFIDDLFGESVAIYKEPKTIEQLDANIRALSIGDPYSSKNVYDFINVDQGLYDYSMVKANIDTEAPNYEEIVEETRVKGLAICKLPTGISKTVQGSDIVLYHARLGDMGTSEAGNYTLAYRNDIYLIADNKVISKGSLYFDGTDGNIKIRFDSGDFEKADYIGAVTTKEMLTGNEDVNKTRVMVMYKVDKYLKG